MDRGGDPEEQHNCKCCDKREAEVEQLKNNFFKWKDDFLDANLLDERLRFKNRAHRLGGSSVDKVEHNRAENKVNREVLDLETEHVTKDSRTKRLWRNSPLRFVFATTS